MTGTLYLVATGAPLARRIPDGVRAARERGWVPAVLATAAAGQWLDLDELAALDVPALAEQRTPDQAKRLPSPDAVAVVPATFNTTNKLAAGIADNYAVSVLCETLGAGVPMVLVPFLKDSLAGHPSWLASLVVLRYAGVTVVDPRDGSVNTHEPLRSGTGEAVADAFHWSWALDRLDEGTGYTEDTT